MLKKLADELLGYSAVSLRRPADQRASRTGKTKKPTPKPSRILASVHKTAKDLHAAGVMDKATMRELDALCLTPVDPMKPK